MFKELHPLLKRTSLHILVAVEGDLLRVNLTPRAVDGENPALATPLSLLASADELDEKLPAMLNEYTDAHLDLRAALDAAKAEISKAKPKDAAKPDEKPKIDEGKRGGKPKAKAAKPEAEKPEETPPAKTPSAAPESTDPAELEAPAGSDDENSAAGSSAQATQGGEGAASLNPSETTSQAEPQSCVEKETAPGDTAEPAAPEESADTQTEAAPPAENPVERDPNTIELF